jgi:hypothetical protein
MLCYFTSTNPWLVLAKHTQKFVNVSLLSTQRRMTIYDVMVCLWRYGLFMTLWFVYDVMVCLWRYGYLWRYGLFKDIIACFMTLWFVWWHHSIFYGLFHDIIVCFYDVLACYITLWLALWHHSLFWWPYDLFAHLKRDCNCKENCPLPLVPSVIYLILYSGFKFQEKKYSRFHLMWLLRTILVWQQ